MPDARGPQLVSDAVARAERDAATSSAHGVDDAQLRHQAGIQIFTIRPPFVPPLPPPAPLVPRALQQAGDQPRQSAPGVGVGGLVAAAHRAQRLDAVVDGLDARAEPDPRRREGCEGWVEDYERGATEGGAAEGVLPWWRVSGVSGVVSWFVTSSIDVWGGS